MHRQDSKCVSVQGGGVAEATVGGNPPALHCLEPPCSSSAGVGVGDDGDHLRAGPRRLSALMHAWCPRTEDGPGWVVLVSGLEGDKGPLGNRGSHLLRQEQAPFLHQ